MLKDYKRWYGEESLITLFRMRGPFFFGCFTMHSISPFENLLMFVLAILLKEKYVMLLKALVGQYEGKYLPLSMKRPLVYGLGSYQGLG